MKVELSLKSGFRLVVNIRSGKKLRVFTESNYEHYNPCFELNLCQKRRIEEMPIYVSSKEIEGRL